VEEVVVIALAKEPQHRFKSVQTFANALEKCYSDEVMPEVRSVFLHLVKSETIPNQGLKREITPEEKTPDAIDGHRFGMVSDYHPRDPSGERVCF